MEFTTERRLQFSTSVVISFVAFENLVKPFEEKGPKSMQRTIVTDALWSMCCIVMIWSNNVRAVQLHWITSVQVKQICHMTDLDELCAVFSNKLISYFDISII